MFCQLPWADSLTRRQWKYEMASIDISKKKCSAIWEIEEFVKHVKILATVQQVIPYTILPVLKQWVYVHEAARVPVTEF